jgi:hypothetical protein
MNVTFPQPPAEILQSTGSSIGTAFSASFFTAKDKASADRFPWVPDADALPEVHEKYTIRFEKLMTDEPLKSAIKLGWRSVEVYENGSIGARLLSQNKDTKQVALLQFNTGPFAESSANAFRLLKSAPRSGNYEFRFLVLPQVYVAAIWLHNPRRNLFFVLDPRQTLFEPQQFLNNRQFFSRIKKLINETIKKSTKL